MSEPDAPRSRVGMLMFVTVSVVFMFCVVIAILLLRAFLDEDDKAPLIIGLVAIILPAAGATSAFLYVARFDSGRKILAGVAVFLGSLAATIAFLPLAVIGLVLSSAAAGGFAVFARRLLDGGSRPAAP